MGDVLLHRDHEAWLEELKPENDRRHDAAIAAARQARDKRIARRAKLTMAALAQDLAIELPADAKAILADDDQQITLSTRRKFGPVTETIHLRKTVLRPDIDRVTSPWRLGRVSWWPDKDGEVRMAELGGEVYEVEVFTIEDGVLFAPDAAWMARIADPTAPKPQYEFLERCPGGYIPPPKLKACDVLVWGARTSRGKEGPYDRLVYHVTKTAVRTLATNYIGAKRGRKLLLEPRKG